MHQRNRSWEILWTLWHTPAIWESGVQSLFEKRALSLFFSGIDLFNLLWLQEKSWVAILVSPLQQFRGILEKIKTFGTCTFCFIIRCFVAQCNKNRCSKADPQCLYYLAAARKKSTCPKSARGSFAREQFSTVSLSWLLWENYFPNGKKVGVWRTECVSSTVELKIINLLWHDIIIITSDRTFCFQWIDILFHLTLAISFCRHRI